MLSEALAAKVQISGTNLRCGFKLTLQVGHTDVFTSMKKTFIQSSASDHFNVDQNHPMILLDIRELLTDNMFHKFYISRI